MNSKILLKLGIGILSITVVLSLVLVTHIYIVTHKPKSNYQARQISRIDFKQKLSSDEATNIRNNVASMQGVENAILNTESGMLIFSYNSNIIKVNMVSEKIAQLGSYKMEKYMPNSEELSMSCPAIGNKNTFRYKLSNFIAQL